MMEEKLIENFLTYYFFNLEQNEPGNNKKYVFLNVRWHSTNQKMNSFMIDYVM